jgi:hypothetical protein
MRRNWEGNSAFRPRNLVSRSQAITDIEAAFHASDGDMANSCLWLMDQINGDGWIKCYWKVLHHVDDVQQLSRGIRFCKAPPMETAYDGIMLTEFAMCFVQASLICRSARRLQQFAQNKEGLLEFFLGISLNRRFASLPNGNSVVHALHSRETHDHARGDWHPLPDGFRAFFQSLPCGRN